MAVEAPAAGHLAVVRVLLVLQGSFALLTTLEALLTGLLTATAAVLLPTVAATGALALATLLLAAALRRRSRLSRRLTLGIESLLLVVGLADLGLSLAMAHAFLDPVPFVTRLVLPVAVVVLLRRPAVRATFARGPSPGEAIAA